ncbi:Phosphoserine phosphatase [Taxawa tesnikishii (nom. ined.)]|nr:Phosphoserine phosphatase [Dothideales sp. JES 119]
MSVNYEVFDFTPQYETPPQSQQQQETSPKPAASGALTQEQWNPIVPIVTYTLQEELSVRRSLTQPHRFLDAEPETDASNLESPCRILEICIPLPTKIEVPTQAQCAAISRSAPILSLCQRHNIELVIQPQPLYLAHRTPGLAVFDMDSTLIQQEVIDELARAVGRYDQVAAITEAAMRGEAPYTDFEASLRARVALLQGVPTTIWEQLRTAVITFTPGARELIRVLKRLGWKTAVLSGGFTPLAEWVKRELGLDYAHANHLVEEDGHLLGALVPGMDIVHAERKRILLESIANENGIPLENVIAVGDGSNDLLMMHRAGLGVAFNAKPKVQMQAPAKLNADGLLDVMHILGYTKDEVSEILRHEMVWEDEQYVLRRPS